jgi:hypothetical protein
MSRFVIRTMPLAARQQPFEPSRRRGLAYGFLLLLVLCATGGAQAEDPDAVQPAGSTGFISGQVTDTAANALSGVEIQVRRQSDDFLVAETTTDGSGEFGPISVAPDSYTVDGSKQFYISASSDVTVSAGTARTVNLVLQRGSGFLNGEVTDENATPIENASVVVVDQANGSVAAQLSSDSEGSFSTELPAANYTITVDHPEYVAFGTQITLSVNETRAIFAVLLSDLVFQSRFEAQG